MHYADGTAHKNRMQGNVLLRVTLPMSKEIPNPCTSCHTDRTTD